MTPHRVGPNGKHASSLALTPSEQRVWDAVEVRQLSPKDAASEIGCSVSAVRTRIQVARAKVRAARDLEMVRRAG